MKRSLMLVAVACLVASGGMAWASEGHEHGRASSTGAAQGGEQTLTGEVVDVFCYLSHGGEQALGKDHASCAKKCIQGGLPVGLKVGDQIYLLTMADHSAANKKMAELAGQQVTVRAKVMERDGQHLAAVSSVEKAR